MKKIKTAPVYFKNEQGFILLKKASPVKRQSLPRAFTLVELIITIVIVGIVATFATAEFLGARQKALRREAQAVLKLIQSAQKVHRLEENSYANCLSLGNWDSDQETCINNNLHLSIPPGGPADDVNWDYETDGANGCTHCRNRATDERMHICIDDEDTSSGTCACP